MIPLPPSVSKPSPIKTLKTGLSLYGANLVTATETHIAQAEWDKLWWKAYNERISHNDQKAFARAHQYMLEHWGPRPDDPVSVFPSKFTLVKLVFRLYSNRRYFMNLGNLIKVLAAFFGAVAAQTSTGGIPDTPEGWIPVAVAGVTTVLAIFVKPPKPVEPSK